MASIEGGNLSAEIRSMVTGLVLAGGRGRRMGGVDKGLQLLGGKPLVAWVIERLAPQVGGVLVNANRNAQAYSRFGTAVVPDGIGEFAGPLAGFHAGLVACRTEFLVTVPCDSPFLPADLVERLYAAIQASGADAAVARSGGRLQPVFALLRKGAVQSLADYLAGGGGKVEAWLTSVNSAVVDFDDAAAFANINTLDELDAASPV